jgi:short-subunit dehydrogenase
MDIYENEMENWMIFSVFSIIGLIYIAIKMFSFLIRTCKNCFKGRNSLFKRFGEGWAIICTNFDPIGKEYVSQLAKTGYDIVIYTPRNNSNKEFKDFLMKIKKECSVKGIFVPFSMEMSKMKENEDEHKDLSMKLKGLNIAILVNALGRLTPSHFEKLSYEDIQFSIKINLECMTLITRIVISLMLKRNRRSAIINISSVLSKGDWPFCCLYCGSKAFVKSLNASLAYELKYKIKLLCVYSLKIMTNTQPSQIVQNHLTSLIYDLQTEKKSLIQHVKDSLISSRMLKKYKYQTFSKLADS